MEVILCSVLFNDLPWKPWYDNMLTCMICGVRHCHCQTIKLICGVKEIQIQRYLSFTVCNKNSEWNETLKTVDKRVQSPDFSDERRFYVFRSFDNVSDCKKEIIPPMFNNGTYSFFILFDWFRSWLPAVIDPVHFYNSEVKIS